MRRVPSLAFALLFLVAFSTSEAAEKCVNQDDDSRVIAWVEEQYPDDGIEGNTNVRNCATALEASKGLLCADIYGPYAALRLACNATCRRCEPDVGDTPTCEQFGVLDHEDLYQKGTGSFGVGVFRSCRHVRTAFLHSGGTPISCRQSERTQYAQNYYGDNCHQSCGFCRSDKLVPYTRVIKGQTGKMREPAIFTKRATDDTALAPILNTEPTWTGVVEPSADMLASDLDMAHNPSWWVPFDPQTETEPVTCSSKTCNCVFRHRHYCGSQNLNEAIWIEEGFEVPFPFLELEFVNNMFTAVTRRLTRTFYRGIISLAMFTNKISRVEPGALKRFPALLLFEPIAQQPGTEFGLEKGSLEGAGVTLPLVGWFGTKTKRNTLPSWWWHSGPNATKGPGMPNLQLGGWCCAQIKVIEPGACCSEFPLFTHSWLFQNLLKEVPQDMLKDNRMLRGIMLNANAITALPPNLFKDAVSFRFMALSDNKIAAIGTDALPSNAQGFFGGAYNLAANPSKCFAGTNMQSGAQSSDVSCICKAGFVSQGKVECKPAECPNQVPVSTEGLTASCPGELTRTVGDTCTATCPAGTIGSAEYVCGPSGLWEGQQALECIDVLPASAVVTIIGDLSGVTFPVPSETKDDGLEFDQFKYWESGPEHYGKDHYKKTGQGYASPSIFWKCIESPTFDNGGFSINREATTMATVVLKWKTGRNETQCDYDFMMLEEGSIGYQEYGVADFHSADVRVSQSNGNRQDIKILMYKSRIKGAVDVTKDVGKTINRTFGQPFNEINATTTIPSDGIGLNAGVTGSIEYRVDVLPVGLNLDDTSGKISGDVKETRNQIDFAVQAVNKEGGQDIESVTIRKYTLLTSPKIEEEGVRGLRATQGSIYKGSIPQVSGGLEPLVFSARSDTGDPWPEGLHVDETSGQISGTPVAPTNGEITVGVQAIDRNGAVLNLATLGLTVVPKISASWESNLPYAVVGDSFGMESPVLIEDLTDVVYRTDDAEIPDGLSFDMGSGKFYGTPTEAGKHNITITLTDGEGSKATVKTAGSATILLEVRECDANSTCDGRGKCESKGDMFDGDFSCTCDIGWENAETQLCGRAKPPPRRGLEDADDTIGTNIIIILGALGLLVLAALMVPLKKRSAAKKKQKQLETRLRGLADGTIDADADELGKAMFASIEARLHDLLGPLLAHGASASARDETMGQLPHGKLLQSAANENEAFLNAKLPSGVIQSYQDAATILFKAHCAFDNQMGSMIQKMDTFTGTLVCTAMSKLAEAQWVASDGTGDTVAHRILDGCRLGALSELQTVTLLETVLACTPEILTIPNAKKRTPIDIAVLCEGKKEVEMRFTVVVFDHYQILRPGNPLYKSPTAEVHECWDLRQDRSGDGAGRRFVVKLMADPSLWYRELLTRDTLIGAGSNTTGFVSATSAGLILPATDDDTSPEEQAAVEYGSSAKVGEKDIYTIAARDVTSVVRRKEATELMTQFPYAIEMPLADRNLSEIISSERLAEEPLDVIRRAGKNLLELIDSLHKVGVVHGDVKPKNVVRVDRELRLIDLDMAVTQGSALMPAHADPIKLGGSTAYAAPELLRWISSHPDGRFEGADSPFCNLKCTEQVDLWSFGVTMYEMATGAALFNNSYDRVTPAARVRLVGWNCLAPDDIAQIEANHKDSESGTEAVVDLFKWMLNKDAETRPTSVQDILSHAFFDTRHGAMHEHLTVDRLRELLAAKSTRPGCNVMISYCWDDTSFVLDKLALELASVVTGMWLDRLGGEQGMGEWAKESMQRGVASADVVIAVVTPSYIQSENCGIEMAFASQLGKTVIPVVFGVPFSAWPPAQVGSTMMTNQFKSTSGDMKLYIDFTDPNAFYTKFHKELLPRICGPIAPAVPTGGGGDGGDGGDEYIDVNAAVNSVIDDDQPPNTTAATGRSGRPGNKRSKGKNKVGPSPGGSPPVESSVDQTDVDTRGLCCKCGEPVLVTQERDVDPETGLYFHTAGFHSL